MTTTRILGDAVDTMQAAVEAMNQCAELFGALTGGTLTAEQAKAIAATGRHWLRDTSNMLDVAREEIEGAVERREA